MISLEKLKLENFISHEDTEIDMGSLEGLIMIEGVNNSGKYDSNGSGKSSIIEGIVYNLTGATLRKFSADGVINRKIKKNTLSQAVYTSNGRKLDIKRHRGNEKVGDLLQVIEDGKDVTKTSGGNKETQKLIDEFVGADKRILLNTIFLGEGLSSKFTQLSDADRKFMIESTLNLPYDLDKSRAHANTELKKYKDQLATAKGRKQSLESVVTGLSEDALKVEKDTLQKSLTDAQTKQVQVQSDLQSLNSKVTTLQGERSTLEYQINQIKTLDTSETTILNEVAYLKGQWTNAGNVGTCQYCRQSLSTQESIDALKSHYMTELQERGHRLQQLKDQRSQMGDQSSLTQRLNEVIQDMTTTQSEVYKLSTELQTHASTISSATARISSIDDLLKNADSYRAEIQTLTKDIEDYEKNVQVYQYWYDHFSPKAMIIKVLNDALVYLNDRIKAYSDVLLDVPYKFELSGGKLTLTDPKGASYETLSNGEKKRLDLAIQFGLHDYVHTYCGIRFDFLFIDEVADGLDPIGVSNFIDVLRMKMQYCSLKKVFVVTHNSSLKSHFDTILLVEKGADEFSRVSII